MKTSSLIAIGMIAPFGCSAREACDKGLHMIVARGTDEPEGGGIMGRIADQIAGEIPDSSVTPVDYPASSDYEQSVPMGISVVTFMIKQYAHSCPDGKMALLGYSQVRDDDPVPAGFACSRFCCLGQRLTWRDLHAGRPSNRRRSLRKAPRTEHQRHQPSECQVPEQQ